MKVQFDITKYVNESAIDGRLLLMVNLIKDTRSNIGDMVTNEYNGVSSSLGLKIAKEICDCARDHYTQTGEVKFALDSDKHPILLELNKYSSFVNGHFDAIKPFVKYPNLLKDAAIALLEDGEYDAAIAVIRAIKRKEK